MDNECEIAIEKGSLLYDGTRDEREKEMDNECELSTVVDKGLSYGQRLLAKLGHKEGSGLGRNGKGIVKPLELKTQLGHRGLGFSVPNFEQRKIEYKEEKVVLEQVIEWCPSRSIPECPSNEMLRSWLSKGSRMKYESGGNEDIIEAAICCVKSSVSQVCAAKSSFDGLDGKEFYVARNKANPFEAIKKAIFQNRAALKPANIDAVSGWMLTNPPCVDDSDVLFFGDVCAGPGGFTEYVYWRRGPDRAKGFGFTLKASNDFAMWKCHCSVPVESFEQLYGVDGTGDITKGDNLRDYVTKVLTSSPNGLDLLMGDGGFDVTGKENWQECLSRPILTAQCAAALCTLKTGGNFITKTFDLFLPLSVSLLFLLRTVFREVAIFKPLTSRPANSERYFVCKDIIDCKESRRLGNYLLEILDMMEDLKGTEEEITTLVPIDIISADADFINYVTDMNETLAEKQVRALQKISDYVRDPSLRSEDQTSISEKCLKLWNIPLKSLDVTKPGSNPRDFFSKCFYEARCSPLSPQKLYLDDATNTFSNLQEWKVLADYSGHPGWLVSCGRGNTFFKGIHNDEWEKIQIPLPRMCLFEVEVMFGRDGATAVFIIDALYVSGNKVFDEPYETRMRKCLQFTIANNRADCAKLIVKPSISLFDVSEWILDSKQILDENNHLRFEPQDPITEKALKSEVCGLSFIRVMKEEVNLSFKDGLLQRYYLTLNDLRKRRRVTS